MQPPNARANPRSGSAAPSGPAPFIVSGMHRSGTSLAAVLLGSSGVCIDGGSFRELRRGYGEDLDFVVLHQELLHDRGLDSSGWTLDAVPVTAAREAEALALASHKDRGGLWAFKDPRTTLFLEFWNRLLPRACFVLVYRAPWDVVDSLFRRGDFAFFWKPVLAVELWIHYNYRLLEQIRRAPQRCVLTHARTIASRPHEWIELLAHRFDRSLSAPDARLVEPSLLRDIHGAAEPRSAHPHVTAIREAFPEALEVYRELQAHDALSSQPGEPFHARQWPAGKGLPTGGAPRLAPEGSADALSAWMESRRTEALAAGRRGWGPWG